MRGGGLQEVPINIIVIFWYFGKLVAEERLHTRGSRSWRFNCILEKSAVGNVRKFVILISMTILPYLSNLNSITNYEH